MALWHVSIPGLVSGLKTAGSAQEAEAAVRALSGVGEKGVASVAEAIGGHCCDPRAILFDAVPEVVPSEPISVIEVVVSDTPQVVTEVVDAVPAGEPATVTEVVADVAPQAVVEVNGGASPPTEDL